MTIKVTYNVTDVYVTQDVSPVYINVSYSGGGSGAAVWGGITGTLSNQTDLQNALNAKYNNPTGTTAQYLRGDGSLATFPAIPSGTVTSVGLTMPSAFSVANSPITSSGTLAVTATGDTTQYIAGDGSLVAFPITGQAGTLVREVRNVTGATLTKGTVVYINGASGNKPTVAKALATSDATSAQTFGLIQADIPNNSNGYLVAFGDLDGLNTSAFAEGVQLYLSSTTAGGYTSTKQYAPNHLVYIGVVTRQHVNQGRIEVRIQNGYEMDELHDVAAQTPSNNDGIFYNSTNSLWENKSIATALGYTPANAATTLTINGVTYDLSTSRTFTVGSVTGSGASGQVAYWTGTTSQAGSNNLFWDATNSRLGIGTNAPDNPLTIELPTGVNNLLKGFIVKKGAGYFFGGNGTSGLNTIVPYFIGVPNVDAAGLGFEGRLFNTSSTNPAFLLAATNNAGTATIGNAQVVIGVSNYLTRLLNIYGNGNLLLQNGGTFTDSGERLQVTGTMKVTGASSFGGKVTISDSTNESLLVSSTAFNCRININNTNATPNAGFNLSLNSVTKWALATYGATSDFTFYNVATSSDSFFIKGSTNNVIIGSTTDVASAIFNVTSTTKGFLPPRMTNAQRTAISSPAVGLIVYCTDTVEGLYVYKSGGWTFVI